MRGGHQHIRNAQARANLVDPTGRTIAPYWGGFAHNCKRNGCSRKTSRAERFLRAIFANDAPAFCTHHGGTAY